MLLKVCLLLTIASTVSYAIVCPPDFCSRVDCEDLTNCLAENGQRVREKGGFCRCCDICVEILGDGQRCMPEGLILGVIIPSECAEGLHCDRTVRRCIKKGIKKE